MKLKQSPLIIKEHLVTDQRGVSIIESLLAASIFALLVTALAGILVYGQQSTALAGSRARAVFLAEEGLEVVRNIADEEFSNLVDGHYGLIILANQWQFSSSPDVTDIYTREVEISSIDINTKKIISNITWQQNLQRAGLVSLSTYLTNWAATVEIGQAEFLEVDSDQASLISQNRRLANVTLENTSSQDIIIDKITVSWDNSNLISRIGIDNQLVWTTNGPGTPVGLQPAGTELDIQDYTMVAGEGIIDLSEIRWNSDMSGSVIDITFTMIDGSTKDASIDFSGGGGDSDQLLVHSSGATLVADDNSQIMGIAIENIGSGNITLDTITVDWTGGPKGNKIFEIIIDGGSVWSGSRNSGQLVDISDFILDPAATYLVDIFDFRREMTGTDVAITFTMTDGTFKIINIDLAGGGDSDHLNINDSNVALDLSDLTQVTGITLENTSGSDITIDQMIFDWQNVQGGNRIEEIIIDGGAVWSGSEREDQIIDITDFILETGQGAYLLDILDFRRNMSGSLIDISFIMSDGTMKTITNITP